MTEPDSSKKLIDIFSRSAEKRRALHNRKKNMHAGALESTNNPQTEEEKLTERARQIFEPSDTWAVYGKQQFLFPIGTIEWATEHLIVKKGRIEKPTTSDNQLGNYIGSKLGPTYYPYGTRELIRPTDESIVKFEEAGHGFVLLNFTLKANKGRDGRGFGAAANCGIRIPTANLGEVLATIIETPQVLGYIPKIAQESAANQNYADQFAIPQAAIVSLRPGIDPQEPSVQFFGDTASRDLKIGEPPDSGWIGGKGEKYGFLTGSVLISRGGTVYDYDMHAYRQQRPTVSTPERITEEYLQEIRDKDWLKR